MTLAASTAFDDVLPTRPGGRTWGARSVALTVSLGTALAARTAEQATRLHPERSELAERRYEAAKLTRQADAIVGRAASMRDTGVASIDCAVAVALDVAWLGAELAEFGQLLFASNLMSVRTDSVTICQIAHGAVVAANVLIAESGRRGHAEAHLAEVHGCLRRVQQADSVVMRPYRYLAAERTS